MTSQRGGDYMSQQVIKGTTQTSGAIRSRRLELGLTIEEAASRANVGTKTWCRYEAGESIRKDKAKGICKALNWTAIPNDNKESDIEFNLDEYKSNEAWSDFIGENHGVAAAVSFVMGSDILLDYIEEDLCELSRLPKGTHVGQLDISMVKDMLPKQFLMEYDYDFLYCLETCILNLRKIAHYNVALVAHSVMQELALYLIVELAEFLMDTMSDEMEACGIEGVETWKEWVFDLFDDMDIVTFLYSNDYLTQDHSYHFVHWKEEQFFMNNLR